MTPRIFQGYCPHLTPIIQKALDFWQDDPSNELYWYMDTKEAARLNVGYINMIRLTPDSDGTVDILVGSISTRWRSAFGTFPGCLRDKNLFDDLTPKEMWDEFQPGNTGWAVLVSAEIINQDQE